MAQGKQGKQDKQQQDKQRQDTQRQEQQGSAADRQGGRDHQGSAAQGKVQGEGDYEAARRYDEKLRDHVQHHDVEKEARDAAPRGAGEQREMERAEEIGKRRAKEEDRLLEHPEGGDASQGGADGASKGGRGR